MRFTCLAIVAVVTISASSIGAQGDRRPAAATGWWPSSGTVILSGGALRKESADALADRLIADAGGPQAPLVVVPTASVEDASLPASGPLPAGVVAILQHLKSRGAQHVDVLHTRD